jgi:hypothetical protein
MREFFEWKTTKAVNINSQKINIQLQRRSLCMMVFLWMANKILNMLQMLMSKHLAIVTVT